ncbi:hypothetical protein EKO04_006916 [Ascochyta lentis]|uniref:Apple domain-containing protein n=1 Tax=Ascochyta lentis TaxID=205686 RepID=A0A8H7J224_9PLEO|nr:hypothetical protein EKO04_006916 [Ascochyta lentis]
MSSSSSSTFTSSSSSVASVLSSAGTSTPITTIAFSSSFSSHNSTSVSTRNPIATSTSTSADSSSPSSSFATMMITTSSALSTSSATSTSSTPTGPTVAATAGIYYSLGCYSEKSGGRALTEVYTNKSMTAEICASEAQRLQYDFMGLQYGQECWMGDSFDTTTSPSLAQSKSNTVCPGNKATTCGSGNTLQMYMLNSTLATPKTEAPARIALSCPASDDQAWAASNGSKFRIECGWDRNGESTDRVTAATYENCLEACAKTAGCGSVALSGQDCYLKTGTLGTRVRKDSI